MRAILTLALVLLGAILGVYSPAGLSAATPTADEATPAPNPFAAYVGLLGEGTIQQPTDLAVGPDGSVWITDMATDQVHTFDAGGTLLHSFGETGQGRGQFEFADFGAVDLDADGNVYILDTGNQRIQKFTPDLTFELEWGRNGSEAGEFQHPSDIAVSDDGMAYVVDAFSGKVQQFDSSGTFVREIIPSEPATQFFEPARIGLDSAGYLYVPDITRVYVFDPDGRQIRVIQTNETDNGSIGLGMGVAVSQSGFVYVSDAQSGRIAVLDPEGRILGYWGSPGSEIGQFLEVDSLDTDDQGRLLVLDFGNRRVQVFQLVESPSATPVATD